jgi:S1-C subfamily serine protease
MPPQFIWPYPKPETIGITLDRNDPVSVKSVAEGGVGAKAGVRAGDAIERAGGQAILTAQDLEWVLHNAPDRGKLELEVRRDGATVKLEAELAADWRRTARRPLFGVVSLGMRLEAVPAAAREKAGIAEGKLALRATNIFKGGGAGAAGFKQGDIIVSVEGRDEAMEDDQLVAWVRMNHARGAKLKFAVLRDGERVELVYEIK